MRHTLVRSTLFAALLLSFAALAAAPAVTVQLDVVHASNQGTEVQPPSLMAMKKSFAQSGIDYKSYRQLSSQKVKLTPNTATQVSLPNGKVATLTLVDVKDNVAQVKVGVPPLETTYSLGRQGRVFIQAGPHNGGTLVLVLSPVAG